MFIFVVIHSHPFAHIMHPPSPLGCFSSSSDHSLIGPIQLGSHTYWVVVRQRFRESTQTKSWGTDGLLAEHLMGNR
jgi:hypothetical protein